MKIFEVEKTDGNARAGKLKFSPDVETPVFMPCATIGAVKGVGWDRIHGIGYKLVLMNALHLYLRPGLDIIRKFHGASEFSGWNGPILTDSGGYQFFSLKGLFKMDSDGVSFQSPYDGSQHRFTPETVVEIQFALGSTIMMPLDHCAPGKSSRSEFVSAGNRTIDWLSRAKKHFDSMCDPSMQSLFGIVQGGTHPDLRKEFLERTVQLDLPGYAMGGISVGEDKDQGDQIVSEITPMFPSDKPRYLMGVGLPGQILEGIASGIDMFDCVLPTRMARNGTMFTSEGRLNIKNSQYREDNKPLDESCDCETCRNYTRAYLAHLYKAGDPGVLGALSVHNLAYYKSLVKSARSAIIDARFSAWRSEIESCWENY